MSKGMYYYRPELDLLRFAAFFMVFLSHAVPGEVAFFAQLHVPAELAAWIIAMAAGGTFGVDLFFALSSFLITTLLIRERHACGRIDVRSFYLRRILRIWPLYFAFLLLVTPLAHYLLLDDRMPANYTLAFAALAGNWACVAWGYPHSIAGPLWSVSIEEQFYLTWPLLLRRAADRIIPIAVTLLAISLISRFWLVAVGARHPQIWCNSLAQLDPIACGALLAVLLERRQVRLSRLSRVALLLMGLATFTVAGRYGDFVGVKALITFPAITAGCIALLLGTLGGLPVAASGCIVQSAAYLGRISYGLYIFHFLFITFFGVTSAHTPMQRLTRITAALLATVLTAAASYRYFEGPFLQLKARFARVKMRWGGLEPSTPAL
ncbi:MAG: acyltransferase family protein [Steroidobacteraceae bacterium]